MEAQDARATLTQVDEVRRQTKADIHPTWFPLFVFGVLGLAASPAAVVGGGPALGLFWLVAGPVGAYATARYYRDRVRSKGVGMRCQAYRPYVTLGVILFVTAWVAGALTRAAVAPMLAIAAGYLGFARFERSWPCAAVASTLALAAVAVGLTHPSNSDGILTLAFGLSFTITGLVLQGHDRG
jgi:hypothetical protein